MARQPLFDRDSRLIGYELLYRKNGRDTTGRLTRDEELAALANVLVEVGLDRLSPKVQAFVNVPSTLLASSAIRLLPPHRVVLEILEDTPWSPAVQENLVNLKKMGYKLALDDYVFGAQHKELVEHVDIVKVDVMGLEPGKLKKNMMGLNKQGKVFLAEKVETRRTFDFCLNLGFDFFQGYFMAEPIVIKGTGIPGNLGLSIALIARLNDPAVSMAELEQAIASNVVLCHKILRLANSMDVRPPSGIGSIRQALQYLGMDRIRTLATLAVTTSLRGKPPELYNLALVRAYFCEAIARSQSFPAPEQHFLVGLLSVLDALTDLNMETLVRELPLSPEIAGALMGTRKNTTYSRALRHVLATEQGDWKAADSVLPGIPEGLYMDAVGKARRDEQLLVESQTSQRQGTESLRSA